MRRLGVAGPSSNFGTMDVHSRKASGVLPRLAHQTHMTNNPHIVETRRNMLELITHLEVHLLGKKDNSLT